MKAKNNTATEPAFLNPEEAFHFIVTTDVNRPGATFSVEFIKRETGETRHMTCRLGVNKRGVQGVGRTMREHTQTGIAGEYLLLGVFDMQKIVIYETATPYDAAKPGKVVATIDHETGAIKYARKTPTAETLDAVAALEKFGVANVTRYTELIPGYHAERGAHRFVPLDAIRTIRAGSMALKAG
jgi:hypothetical protein